MSKILEAMALSSPAERRVPASHGDFVGFQNLLAEGRPLTDTTPVSECAPIILAAHVTLQIVLDHAPGTQDRTDLASVSSMLRWLRGVISTRPSGFDTPALMHGQILQATTASASQLLLELVFALRTRHNGFQDMPVRFWFQPDFNAKILVHGLPALIRAKSSNPGTPKPGLRGACTLQGVLDMMLHQQMRQQVPFPGSARALEASAVVEAVKMQEKAAPVVVDVAALVARRMEAFAEDVPHKVALRFLPTDEYGWDEYEAEHMGAHPAEYGEQVRRWANRVRSLDGELWAAGYDVAKLPKVSDTIHDAFCRPDIPPDWLMFPFRYLTALLDKEGRMHSAVSLDFDPATAR